MTVQVLLLLTLMVLTFLRRQVRFQFLMTLPKIKTESGHIAIGHTRWATMGRRLTLILIRIVQ